MQKYNTKSWRIMSLTRELQLGKRFIFQLEKLDRQGSRLAKSKPRSQSNQQFVVGLEKNRLCPILK